MGMMESKVSNNLNAALILFLIMAAYTLAINLGGYQSNTTLTWLSYIIVVTGIMFSVLKYGKNMQGNVTFGNLFAYGFRTTATLIIFFIGFSILFYILFPKYKLHLIDMMKENYSQNMSPDSKPQAEEGVELIQRFWVSMIAGILISFAILGAAGSLLGAAFAKKKLHRINNDFNQIN